MEDQEETIADLLLFKNHNEETIIRNRDDLYKLWKRRQNIGDFTGGRNTRIMLINLNKYSLKY